MKKLEQLIEELRTVDISSGRDSVVAFEQQLAAIANASSPEIVPALIGLLDDASPSDEAMFSIIHCMETIDDRNYIHGILEKAPTVFARSPKWLEVLFIRIMNSPSATKELTNQLLAAKPEQKKVAIEVLQRINKRGEKFLQKTASPLKAAQA